MKAAATAMITILFAVAAPGQAGSESRDAVSNAGGRASVTASEPLVLALTGAAFLAAAALGRRKRK